MSFAIRQPASTSWSDLAMRGLCGNLRAGYISLAIFDVAVDFLKLVLPFPMLWRLQIPKATRAALTLVFSMGIVTIIVGSIRPAAIIQVDQTDVFYSGVLGHVLTVVENGVAIIVSSSPFLRPILLRVTSGFNSLTRCTKVMTSGKQSSGRTDDERHLVGNIPIILQARGHHDDESMELEVSRTQAQTAWPGTSSETVV
ncbi:hypothetical protein BBP40_010288 [Aspergillus hancockii]|nr:hypothetical protein BBP40_010288 [Aspergillus hancockii]